LPDGSVQIPDDLKEEFADVISMGSPLIQKQRKFAYCELNDVITKTLMGPNTYEFQKNFLYIKVLMAWYIVIDPRSALDCFSKIMELCQSIVDDGMPSFSQLDILINLINSVLYSILSDAELSTTIDVIDQQKHNGLRTFFSGSGASEAVFASLSVNRYLEQLSNTSSALVQYSLP
jgi:hypothetical protein